MPEMSPEVQAFVAGLIVWLLLWAIRKSPWAGNVDHWTGYISAAVVAGVAAFAVELNAPPFEVVVFLRAWFLAFAVSQSAYNTGKRLVP